MFRLIRFGFVFLLFGSTSQAAIIAFNDFDASLNLTSSSSSPVAFNSFSSGGDGWGTYSYAGGGPFGLFDDSTGVGGAPGTASGGNDPFPADTLGLVQSTKTDSFFGITDTTNGDVSNGEMTAEFVFDISSAAGGLTSIDVDFAGMGDFEVSDDLVLSFSIDGSAFAEIMTDTVDEAGSANYTMQDGDVVTLDDPMSMNGVELTNEFQTVSAAVTGTGNSLTLRVFADTDGGAEALALDNIVINGSTAVPEPSSLAIVALFSVIGLTRRRTIG